MNAGYTHIGAGFARGGEWGRYYVQVFGGEAASDSAAKQKSADDIRTRHGGATISASGWGKRRITYRDASTYGKQVTKAANMFNQSGVRIQLVAVARRSADITIRTSVLPGNVAGWAFLPPGGQVAIDRGLARGGGSGSIAYEVVAHELGHAVGLPHNTGSACTLMAPVAYLRECSGGPRCGLQPVDVRQLGRLYGWRHDGRERARSAGTCGAAPGTPDSPTPTPDAPDSPDAEPQPDPGLPSVNEGTSISTSTSCTSVNGDTECTTTTTTCTTTDGQTECATTTTREPALRR